MLFGATSGIIRGVKTPILFSLVSGFQWFGISSVFYGTPSPCPAGRTTHQRLRQEDNYPNILLQVQGN